MSELGAGEIRCPFCGSADTELMSLFGQQLLTMQYYCEGCRTPFERVRAADVLADIRKQLHADEAGQRG